MCFIHINYICTICYIMFSLKGIYRANIYKRSRVTIRAATKRWGGYQRTQSLLWYYKSKNGEKKEAIADAWKRRTYVLSSSCGISYIHKNNCNSNGGTSILSDGGTMALHRTLYSYFYAAQKEDARHIKENGVILLWRSFYVLYILLAILSLYKRQTCDINFCAFSL